MPVLADDDVVVHGNPELTDIRGTRAKRIFGLSFRADEKIATIWRRPENPGLVDPLTPVLVRQNMVDTYTKIILTLIAGALVAMVTQNALKSAYADGPECGGKANPCWVASDTSFGVVITGITGTLPVRIAQ